MLRGSVIRSVGRIASGRTFGRSMATEEAVRDPTKLLLNFLVPSASIKKNLEVDSIQIPAAMGQMGILPDHVPTVAQMPAGVVAVHQDDKVERYFISSGYTFIHKDRTDVCAAEAASLEDIDGDLVKQSLSECTAALSAASTEEDKAIAQIGVDLYTALEAAMKA